MAQQQRLQERRDRLMAAGRTATPKIDRRLNRIQNKLGALGADPSQETQTGPTPTDINSAVNTQITGLVPQIGGSLDLSQLPQLPQPGDYGAMRQKAYDTAMGQFERSFAPQAQQQEAAFQQQMADRGIPMGSEAYNKQYQQMQESQNMARQNAMDRAFQLGQREQEQQFQQGFNTRGQAFGEQYQNAQLPIAGLGALGNIYGAQQQGMLQDDQQAFQKELAALQQRYNLQQIKATPRGGGGGGGAMSMADRFALMDRELYNDLAMQGAQQGQMPQPNYVNAGIGGIAQGLGAGIMGSLLK
jgi:hypothetical protein